MYSVKRKQTYNFVPSSGGRSTKAKITTPKAPPTAFDNMETASDDTFSTIIVISS
jgi:hypothetical protein